MMAADMRPLLQHETVQAVGRLAQAHGGRAWLVGGAVRDWLHTGNIAHDLDFALVDCRAETLAKTLADAPGGHLVPLDADFGIHRVVFDGGPVVDLSDALHNDLGRDLARRDLTVNAMALDLHSGELLDPFDGQADLAAGRIRMVSAGNLLEDPLRLLRVFRLAATLGAREIDAATMQVVRDQPQAVWGAAPERIQYELLRLLDATPCFDALQAMADSGLLEAIIPDLTPMRAIGASGFHHLGLFEHSLELVRQCERLLPELPEPTRAWVSRPFNQNFSRLAYLKLACLLHDIGKPATRGTRLDPDHGERLTFYGHEEVGEQMAGPWLGRLKFGNEARDYVKKLIRWHLYPCQFGPESSRRSVLRFYRRMGAETPDVLLLALADRHSSCGCWISDDEIQKAHDDHIWLMADYAREEPVLKTPRLLSGHDVMAVLGLPPGPHLKPILEALQEAQQLGEISTPEEARAWLSALSPPPS